MYVYGCVATLVVTFAVLSYLLAPRSTGELANPAGPDAARRCFKASARYLDVLRAGALIALALTILAGVFGGQAPERNLAMIMFWVVFLLAFSYATALLGNLFPLINPWATLVDGLERLGIDLSKRRVRYPAWLSHWPALICYMALIWIELFAPPLPRTVSVVLLVYTVATLAGVTLFGKITWFSQVDFFSTYFGLIGKLAPIEHARPDQDTWQLRLRRPLAGALHDPPRSFSLVLFVLFMLASTTYDSVHETALWAGLFWRNLLLILQPLWGTDIQKAQDLLMGWYLFYRQAGLIVFPFLYLAIYLLFVALTRLVLGRGTITTIAFSYCHSLLPIAIAYHFTHYFPFLVSLADDFPRVLSDPLVLGWNLLPIPASTSESALPMGLIWHTQVGVLLLGHLASIYLAHRVALQSTSARGRSVASQLPLLLLMVIYTVIGLWVLSLPLAT